MSTVLQPAPPLPAATAGDHVRTFLRGLGQTLITLGVVLLLFCVYELYVTGLYTDREQDRLGDDLQRSWQAPPPPPPAPGQPPAPVPLGDAFARFYLPTLRGDDPLVVVQGVGVEDLKKGPGHLPSSALPGETGNLVFSGHRTTYGAPFNQLDRLRPGDPLVVETRTSWVTYRVTGSQVVSPTAVEVTYPVPGQPGVAPTQALITLTTCNPKYSAKQRLIVRGELVDVRPADAGEPPALTGAQGG